MDYLQKLPNIQLQTHDIQGQTELVTEIYLIGDTENIPTDEINNLPAVAQVVRIQHEYRMLARHGDNGMQFKHHGVQFSQQDLVVFPGLNAVDNRANVEQVFKCLQDHKIDCARMGAYKPRTSPYSFQGLGAACLPYVFELAGKYGIKIIALEVTSAQHVDEVEQALAAAGAPCGVMLQIGTRNAQNYELLKTVGQRSHPVLFKRGFGITLTESLNAAEYIALAGNLNIVFCLRGVKSIFSEPHRNMVDFAQVSALQRLTRMPIAIDPSHSVGLLATCPQGIPDIFHATAQGVIAGANMILVDFHPDPKAALVDSKQALSLKQLPYYLADIEIARDAYQQRIKLAQQCS